MVCRDHDQQFSDLYGALSGIRITGLSADHCKLRKYPADLCLLPWLFGQYGVLPYDLYDHNGRDRNKTDNDKGGNGKPVFWHVFIIYQGGWHKPEYYSDVKLYWWIAKFAISFSLELFTFVSGYVFALQNIMKPKSFGDLVKTKAKRLLVPCIIFSLLYLLVISGFENKNFFRTILSVLCGVGHLWYLSMLFVVFVIAWFIVRLNTKIINYLIVFLFALATVVLAIKLPYNIPQILYYLPFFLMGYYFYKYKNNIDNMSYAEKS